MSYDFDVCVIGSGAGGGPVAFTLAKAGYSVLVLEKGPWLTEKDFFKDELACCRRNIYTSNLREEPHVVEMETDEGGWTSQSTYQSGWNFWNGNCVGGSSNFMSGFFHRLKPKDFRLLSEFGSIEGANIADWPISYNDLEPYYAKVESVVGVSGAVTNHPLQEPRSTKDFPYPPTEELAIASWFDEACQKLGYYPLKVPWRLCGDVNRDGSVDRGDAAAVRNHWGFGYAICNLWAADVNYCDGFVDRADASAIRNHWGFGYPLNCCKDC